MRSTAPVSAHGGEQAVVSAHALVRLLLQRALAAPEAQRLDRRLRVACSVRLRDMVDHIRHRPAAIFADLGWRRQEAPLWRAPHPALPDVVEDAGFTVVLRVACIDRFLAAIGSEARIEGASHGPYRYASIFKAGDVGFAVAERHGWIGHEPPILGERKLRRARLHQQIFRTRRRQFQSGPRAIAHTMRLAEAAATDLGGPWAGALFLRAEREYWVARCAPALRQHQRQLAAGVGWCTVSHHAYACSRESFADTRRILETLGHAGAGLVRPHHDANWGGQIMDASATGAAPYTMLCVDLAAHEHTLGEAGAGLSPLTWLGPPGVWCGLHGESLLEAGLCCVSAAYDIEALSDARHRAGKGGPRRTTLHDEHRAVDPRRVAVLERARYISRPQAEIHSTVGAVGAQFEVLQRAGASPAPPDFAHDVCISPSPPGAPKRRRARVKQLSW